MQQPQTSVSAEDSGGRLLDGVEDFRSGLASWPLWSRLGWNDIRLRYRRSVLGPFWITLSVTIFIAFLGLIFSRLFGIEIEAYLPYFAVGYIIWGFISSTVIESCGAFHESGAIMRQRKIPFSIFIFKIIWRNLIVLLHTALLIIAIYFIFRINPGLKVVLAVPGIFLLCLNQVWLGMVLAILSTRFADVIQIIGTMVQITFFATPIMWPASRLGDAIWVAKVNPAYHFIQLIRAPLLGELPDALSWLMVLMTITMGTFFAVWLTARMSRRIVYWL